MSTYKLKTKITGQPTIIGYSDTKFIKVDFTKSILPIRYRIGRIEDARSMHPYKEVSNTTDFSNMRVPEDKVLTVWSDLPFIAELEFDTEVPQALPYPTEYVEKVIPPVITPITATDTASLFTPPAIPLNSKPTDQIVVTHANGIVVTWTIQSDGSLLYSIKEKPITAEFEAIYATTSTVQLSSHNNAIVAAPTTDITLTIPVNNALPNALFSVHNLTDSGAEVTIKITGKPVYGYPADTLFKMNKTGKVEFKIAENHVLMIGLHDFVATGLDNSTSVNNPPTISLNGTNPELITIQ